MTLPTPCNLGHRQLGDEPVDLLRGNHEQPVRLAPVAGDLGQELVRRDARRNGDVQLLGHPAADVLGNPRGATGEMRRSADVQVGLVQRKRLDQIGIIAEDRMDLLRHRPVDIETRAHHQQIGTQLERRAHGHRRAHAIGSRLVAASGDHSALVRRTANRQRLAAQAGVVAHLEGGIETVAVYMDDFPHRNLATSPAGPAPER